jgi:hypothetical protein
MDRICTVKRGNYYILCRLVLYSIIMYTITYNNSSVAIPYIIHYYTIIYTNISLIISPAD